MTPEAGFCADFGGRPRGRLSATFGSLSASGDERVVGLRLTSFSTAFSAAFAARTADAGTKFSTHRLHPRLAWRHFEHPGSVGQHFTIPQLMTAPSLLHVVVFFCDANALRLRRGCPD